MNLDGANILVTGGCGLIGSTTIDEILATSSPQKIVIFDNLSRGSMRNVENILKDDRVELVTGDIRDAKAVEQVTAGIDAVIHMAAIRITACAADTREAMRRHIQRRGSGPHLRRQEDPRGIFSIRLRDG